MKKLLPSLLCIAATLCLGLGLTACGDSSDGGKKEEITLVANTDFTALVSEKVDESGWKKALTLKNYTVNFTNYITVNDAPDKDEYTVKYNCNELFYSFREMENNMYHNPFEASIRLNDDNSLYYYYYTHDIPMFSFSAKIAESSDDYNGLLETYNSYMVMYCPDFSDRFSSFTYDETKHSYVCAEVKGSALFESGKHDVNTETYTSVEIKIVNGRLAYLTAKNKSGDKIVSRFYDFGKTTITYEEVRELTELPK